MVAAAATLFVLAAMPNLAWAAVVAVWLGAFCGLAWVSGYTLLQENVEDEFRGRTFAALTVLSRLGLFLSLTIFPILSGCLIGAHGDSRRAALRSLGHPDGAVDGRRARPRGRAQHPAAAPAAPSLPTRSRSSSCRS